MNSDDRLTKMIEQYQNLVFSVCIKLTQDYFTAEDLTQETFLSAYRHLEQFDGANEKAWLCRIASNKCIDYMRQAERRSLPAEEEMLNLQPSKEGLPETSYLQKTVFTELKRKCGNLSPPYDRVATMYFVEEKSAAEIATLMKMKLKTVQTQIYRARALLRRQYGKG